MEKALHFFLGANTPHGFVSRFEQIASSHNGERLYLVKGGPGSGKSTLLRHVGQSLQNFSETVEWIHCSSDVDSLDGVILPDIKVAVADATPPHTMEPQMPGAFEQPVNLCDCWNTRMLYEKAPRIAALSGRISACHQQCCQYLRAAAGLQRDTYRIGVECCDSSKVGALAKRMSEKLFTPKLRGRGREKIRFLSAVTNKGPVQFNETVQVLCKEFYGVEDPLGAVSGLFLGAMRSDALERGYDVIVSYCPLSPFEKLEYLFVPSLEIGFGVVNEFHRLPMDSKKTIRFRRFTDGEELSKYKKRLTFQKKAVRQLIGSASAVLAEAKAFHDDLERYYIAAMDFGKVESLEQKLIEELSAFAAER